MSDLVPSSAGVGPNYGSMHGDIVALLEAARQAAARSVNALMTASYWEIGRRIIEFQQWGQERAAYGQALLKRLSVDLTERFAPRILRAQPRTDAAVLPGLAAAADFADGVW